MPDRSRTPAHSVGEPYSPSVRPHDFEACREWPFCGCLRECDETTAAAPRRAARRFRLIVLLSCAVPTLYAAFLFLSLRSAP